MNFFIENTQIEDGKIYITGTDVNHIKNVLRKKIGDIISVISAGETYKAQIEELNNDKIICSILDKIKSDNCTEPKITIFQGLAKSDKIEYIIQKCTELGCYEVVPVEMSRSVVKIDEKDKTKKIERWKKIAEVAAKQSLRTEILKVDKIMNINGICNVFNQYDYVIVAYEKENTVKLKDVLKTINIDSPKIAVIIGPEGGFDEKEIQQLVANGAKTISLGKRILRTETAPIAVSAIIMYELEKG